MNSTTSCFSDPNYQNVLNNRTKGTWWFMWGK